MSIESSKVLRSGRVLENTLQHTFTENTTDNISPNMENSNNSSDETNRSGRNSPIDENLTQVANEERFNRLQDEMSIIKTMMEKLISQNEERNKQNGGSIATSSLAVGTSNSYSMVFPQPFIHFVSVTPPPDSHSWI